MESQTSALVAAEKPVPGPHTKRGKAMSCANATTHGLGCKAVVIRGERKTDWESHRAGMIAAISPVGTLEQELTEQVAILTWRMRRVVRYENGVMSGRTDSNGRPITAVRTIPLLCEPHTRQVVQKEIQSARTQCQRLAALKEGYCRLNSAHAMERFDGRVAWEMIRHARDCMNLAGEFGSNPGDYHQLTSIGLPLSLRSRPETWDGWTADNLMKAMWYFGQCHHISPTLVVERTMDNVKVEEAKALATLQKLESELLGQTAAIEESKEEEAVEDHEPIFDQVMLTNVMRYGSYLRKELNETLEMLDRLQSNRKGMEVIQADEES